MENENSEICLKATDKLVHIAARIETITVQETQLLLAIAFATLARTLCPDDKTVVSNSDKSILKSLKEFAK